jgi:signal transduction histidine kinase/CheY-like chemotaxis protein
MVVFSFVIVMVVAIISLLVQHYVVQETTKTEINNARLQRDQAVKMIEIAWENHLYHRKTLLAERRNLLSDVTAIAFGVIKNAREKAVNHEITEDEAKKLAMDTIRNMRFSNGAGYFWIQDCQKPIPYMLMHPVVPALDGKPCNADVCYTALDDGSNLNAKFVEICQKSKKKEAFLPYRWPKPTKEGLSEIQPKLSFVKIYPEWGWLIGTGLYIDDIERESNKNLELVKEKIIKNLSSIRIAKSGYIFIFDKNLNFVAHPTLRGVNGGDRLRPDTGTSILKDLIKTYNGKNGELLKYMWEKPGGKKGEYYKKIGIVSYFEPLGWYICASVYEDELEAPAQQLMTKILLASVALLFIALFFAWWLSKSVSKPIVHLATTAKKIEKGEIKTIEPQAGGLVEIESLATCLRDMLVSLNKVNDRLRQTQKMEAIGQLAGGIAHDFNNMLSGIMGCAALLEKRLPKDSPHLKYISMINDSANRAAELAAQLLTFSRKEALLVSRTDLHSVILDAIAILGTTIDKRISIKTELKAEKCIIEGEHSQLQTVFINLGINASHAMPDGGELSFSTRVVRGDASWSGGGDSIVVPGLDYIEISVVDTGVGMSPETLTHIFEPFFTTKGLGEGTGLGLASAYGIVQQHKGMITADSVVGEGSQFKIVLPLAAVKTDEVFQPVEYDPSELTTGTGTVLVVDDEEVLRFILERILVDCGYRVLLAENGKEAIDIYTGQAESIDLVVCDMIMPEMNGSECFQKLKKINPDIKFIIASGFTKDNSVEELKKKGLSGFIKKPFKAAAISQLIARIMKADS